MGWFRKKFRQIKRFFTGNKPPTKKTIDKVEKEIIRRNEGEHRTYKRVALVRGHTNSSSGCGSYPVKMPSDFHDRPDKSIRRREYDLNGYVIKKIKEKIDVTSFSMAVKEFLRDGIGIRGVGKLLKKWNPDLVISFHKNSIGDNPNVAGREILLLKEFKGTKVEEEARRLLRLLNKYVGHSRPRHDDGIKWLDYRDRGELNLSTYSATGTVTLLIEPEFIGAKNLESKRLLENDGLEKYATAVAQFCLGEDVQ